MFDAASEETEAITAAAGLWAGALGVASVQGNFAISVCSESAGTSV
jgi:hypothetical protein